MQTPTIDRTDATHKNMGEFLHHELDQFLAGLLAPITIDFSHMDWGSQRDETWM